MVEEKKKSCFQFSKLLTLVFDNFQTFYCVMCIEKAPLARTHSILEDVLVKKNFPKTFDFEIYQYIIPNLPTGASSWMT